MRSICLYFQVHQPFRLRTYRFFDIGIDSNYYDEYLNRSIAQRVAERSYLPANRVLLELIKEFGDLFKVSFSISGIALEQFRKYAPDVITSFQQLAETGNVEFLAETYAHSLASLRNKDEFVEQVEKHSSLVMELFGQKPSTFRNTELIYSDEISQTVLDMGFTSMLTEGAKHILGWKSPNYLYCSAGDSRLKVMLRNFTLSDDIAFRFSNQSWNEWPMTPEKFAGWMNALDENEEVVNIFIDYETFGEHQWKETGIFDFLKSFPGEVLSQTNYRFLTPKEIASKLQPVSAIHVPYAISWADEERDITAWLGNDLQDEAFDSLYELRDKVKLCDESIKRDWYYLQTSDHFYYMCTKWFSDGDVHKYFNPYPSPYEAFINYMNVLADFVKRVNDFIEKSDLTKRKSVKQVVKSKQTVKTKAKKARYTFIDLNEYPKAKIRQIIKDIELEVFAKAMLNIEDPMKNRFIGILGKRNQKNDMFST